MHLLSTDSKTDLTNTALVKVSYITGMLNYLALKAVCRLELYISAHIILTLSREIHFMLLCHIHNT